MNDGDTWGGGGEKFSEKGKVLRWEQALQIQETPQMPEMLKWSNGGERSRRGEKQAGREDSGGAGLPPVTAAGQSTLEDMPAVQRGVHLKNIGHFKRNCSTLFWSIYPIKFFLDSLFLMLVIKMCHLQAMCVK